MSHPVLKVVRFAFGSYLIAAILLIIASLVYFNTPFAVEDLLTALIVHPAAGWIISNSSHPQAV